MKHSIIIKKINHLFLESWTFCKVRLDSTENIKDKEQYISLNYMPLKTKQLFLGDPEKGLRYHGNLRIFIYGENQTKTLEILDNVILFLRNQYKNDLFFEEQEILGAPTRENVEDLFSSFVDFKICYKN